MRFSFGEAIRFRCRRKYEYEYRCRYSSENDSLYSSKEACLTMNDYELSINNTNPYHINMTVSLHKKQTLRYKLTEIRFKNKLMNNFYPKVQISSYKYVQHTHSTTTNSLNHGRLHERGG